VVLRLWGSELSCSEAGSNYVVTPPNRELSEPFGRSDPQFHITIAATFRERQTLSAVRALASSFGPADEPCRRALGATAEPDGQQAGQASASA
jgi:hypothetical protein